MVQVFLDVHQSIKISVGDALTYDVETIRYPKADEVPSTPLSTLWFDWSLQLDGSRDT